MGVRKILQKKFFFQSEHVSSQIWCQKFSPLLGGGVSENFFYSLNMYQAKSDVKKISLYWVCVWFCENFFPQSEHVSSQIWCPKFFPLLGEGVSENFFSQSEHVSSQTAQLKIFHFTSCIYLAYLRSYSHLNIVKYIGVY